MYREHGKGMATLNCRVCGADYQTVKVNYLTEPIDVFCEWYDACETENVAGADDEDE